ncbi:hypothetical protein GCM10023237_14640 [Streptomyces coeruleoprunus]
MLDRTNDAVRQMAHRARKHVRDRRPLFADGRLWGVIALALSPDGRVRSICNVLNPDKLRAHPSMDATDVSLVVLLVGAASAGGARSGPRGGPQVAAKVNERGGDRSGPASRG